MAKEVIRVIRSGMGLSVQDSGRFGLAKWGVPAGGFMDDHAATWCNRLLDNPPDAPVLELLMQGAHIEVLQTCWMVVAGADTGCNLPRWRMVRAHAGEGIVFPLAKSGLWSYVAVEGGFAEPRFLGSSSAYPRGGIGRTLKSGDVLWAENPGRMNLPDHVAGRLIGHDEQRDYRHPPALRVWRGPQWEQFHPRDRSQFFQQKWSVSLQSDRVGYRLEGGRVAAPPGEILSEPVLPGSIQVPAGGQPIVTMRDGPTVGGYPKIGLVEPEDLSWLAQCRPGISFRFRLVQ